MMRSKRDVSISPVYLIWSHPVQATSCLLVGAGADTQLEQGGPSDLLSMELSKVGQQLQTLLGNYFDAELSNCELIKCYMIA